MPVYRVQAPDGKIYRVEGPPNADPATLFAVVQQQVQPPSEGRSYIGDLGRAMVRGAGAAISGVGSVLEDLPAIAEYANPSGALLRAITPDSVDAAKDQMWKDVAAPAVEGVRGVGQGITDTVAPRERAGIIDAYQKDGFLAGLAAAGETVAESAPITLAGIGTALATKNPTAAMAAMGITGTPQTYAGVRERQKAEGVDDVGAAVAGTAVSSALDILTGTGGAVTRIGKELLEQGFRKAVKEVARTSVEESGTEVLQNVIEQVAGGSDPTTKQAMLETLEAGLAGALGGAVFSSAIETGSALGTKPERSESVLDDEDVEETPLSGVERFTQYGIPEDVARTVVTNSERDAAAVERQAEEFRRAREESVAARTAGGEPSPEPNIEAPGMVIPEPVVRAPPPVDAEEQAAMYRAYEEEAGPAPAPPDPQQTDMTPERAAQILNDDGAIKAFADTRGVDLGEALDILEAVADGLASIRYSRGRRPKDTETASLFDDVLAFQQAPGEELKRAEYNEFRFAPPEQKAAIQEQAADELRDARLRGEERLRREAEEREEVLGDMQFALRAQAPENAVYRTVYEPEDKNAPYKLIAERELGKPGEEVLRAKTLQEFSNKIYGDMHELTPYIPPTPAALQEIEPSSAREQKAPTEATRMIQDFVREVDAAREAGQIDNLQRSQLLGRLQRPNAYRTLPNGNTSVPNDAIAKLEAEVFDTTSALRDAKDKAAAEAAVHDATQRLRAAVQNSLLNPARAALKSMVEMRQDEKVGAKSRVESAQLQRKLGAMEGDKAFAEQNEERDAKIDLEQLKVQKYKRAEKPSKGIAAKDVQRVVRNVTKNWKSKNPVTVVQSVADIKDTKVKRALARDKAMDANGFVTPDGTIYLVADNLQSEAEAKAVLFHEALGHLGLEKLFRDELDKALVAMHAGNAKLRADTTAWQKANSDAYAKDKNPLARAVEEVLAERSEQGQLKPSLLQRIAAIIRDFARRIGMSLAITDADVRAILSLAHEQVVSGPQERTATKGMRYTPQTTKELADMEADISTGVRRVNNTQNTYAAADGLTEAIKSRKLKPVLEALKENYDGMKPSALKATLISLPTSGILDWFGKDIPSLLDVDKLILRMSNMKANIIKAAENTALELDKFLVRDKGKQLARVQAIARINEISPDEHASMADALKNDKVMQEITDRILQNANNKKLAQQLIDQIKTLTVDRKSSKQGRGPADRQMSDALQALLKRVERDAKDRTKSETQVEQLAEITRRIRDTYAEWDKLKEVKGGQRLYRKLRAFYKDMFDAELALLDSRLRDITGDDQTAQRLRDMRAEKMREAQSPGAARKRDDVFWDVDSSLFTKDYSPFMREGKYWLRAPESKKKGQEREFFTFHTAKERDRAAKKMARRLGVAPDTLEMGNDVESLAADLKSEDLVLQAVFDEIGKVKRDVEATGKMDARDVEDLFDAVYQTYLLSTPERSVRRRLMHAEEVTGFSQDILNHFSRQVTSYANQLSKMAFAGQVRNQIKGAREGVKDDAGRPGPEKAKLNDVIDEIEARAEQEINPDPQNALVNFLNRMSYFYYLTSPATALVQTTSIPIRVMPRLWKDYGFTKSAAKWGKYMKVWETLGLAGTEKIKTGWGDELHAKMPSIAGSKLVNNNPLLKRALAAGMDLNVLETVTDTLLQNEREVVKKHREGVGRAVSHHAAETAKAMGVLFQGMENLSRQAAYFMTFELAYEDYLAKHPGQEEDAFNHGVDQGLDVVRNTLGEYGSWERPRLAKGNWTRALFLFKMYSIVQTKFLVQNFRALTKDLFSVERGWKPAEAKAARAAALKELTGVTMMAGLFGGLMGMPLYSLTAAVFAALFGPDADDDDDVRELMGDDPRTAYDSDLMFRRWVADKFGTPDRKDTDMADMLIHGPIAALTDTELASRVSLDFKNMWFREAVAGDSTAMTVIKTAMANIAPGQMLVQMLNSYDDWAEGDIDSALKKMLPAFFRSPFAAAQQEREGVQDRKGNMYLKPEDITTVDTVRTLLGLRGMRLARAQDYTITRAKNDKRIEGERTSLLRALDKKVREGDIKTEADLRKFWKEEIIPFNRTYPDEKFIITPETLVKSIEGRNKTRADTIQGMQLDKDTAEKDLRAARSFLL